MTILGRRSFSFWVSPCTLKFDSTYALTIDIDRVGGRIDMLEVADLYLVSKIEGEANEWAIELQDGKIGFKSSGFEQYVRQPPVLTQSQILSLEQRNGISFAEITYDT